MKILILSDQFENGGGGAVSVVRNIAGGFKKHGHEISVITATKNKGTEKYYDCEGIKVFPIYSDYNLFWRPYLSLFNSSINGTLKKIITDLKPDIVHAHNIHIHLSYHALKIAKNSGAKVFLTAHDVMLFHYGKLVEFINKNDLSCPKNFNYKISICQQIKKAGKTYNPFRNVRIRHYLKYVDKIFAVSGALKDALEQNGIDNVEVIHNGINADEWAVGEQAVNDFKSKFNLGGKKIILFGGRLSELKGGVQIILAMQEIIKKANNAVLVILGNRAGYAETLSNSAKQKGLENNIIFTGWLSGDELKAAFNSADVVVSPSICFDSFPTVNLEAMACKKPIISACFGGAREVVIDGQTGYIINPYDIQLLADKIISLLINPEKAKDFGKAGYERVKNEFNLEKVIKQHLKWYQSFN